MDAQHRLLVNMDAPANDPAFYFPFRNRYLAYIMRQVFVTWQISHLVVKLCVGMFFVLSVRLQSQFCLFSSVLTTVSYDRVTRRLPLQGDGDLGTWERICR